MDCTLSGDIPTIMEYDPFKQFQAALSYLNSDHSAQCADRHSQRSRKKQAFDNDYKIYTESRHRSSLSFSEEFVLYSQDMRTETTVHQEHLASSQFAPSKAAIGSLLSHVRHDNQVYKDNLTCKMGNHSNNEQMISSNSKPIHSRQQKSKNTKRKRTAVKMHNLILNLPSYEDRSSFKNGQVKSLTTKSICPGGNNSQSKIHNNHKINKNVKRLNTSDKQLQQNGIKNIKLSIDFIKTLLK